MIWLIDIGNARVKWARLGGDGQLLNHGVYAHRGRADWAVGRLCKAMTASALAPNRIFVSNVAGSNFTKTLTQAAKKRWSLKPEFAKTETETLGVATGYAKPERLGVDRWLAVVAASKLSTRPVVVVDAGTALTIDCVHENQHLGGAILPGQRLMLRALNKGTSDIGAKAIDLENMKPTLLLADNTDGAVGVGAMLALTGAIERTILGLTAHCGAAAKLVLTGGDSDALLPLLNDAPLHRPHLVLEGLGLIANA